MTSAVPFHRKRYRFLYLLLASTSSTCDVRAEISFDYADGADKTTTVSAASTGAVWDSATWDSSHMVWFAGHQPPGADGEEGREWKLRLSNNAVDTNLTVHKIAMSGELLTDQNHAD
jgi:hypothetical protein